LIISYFAEMSCVACYIRPNSVRKSVRAKIASWFKLPIDRTHVKHLALLSPLMADDSKYFERLYSLFWIA